jgi:serine/threonine-protein kinase RsbW
VRTALRLFPAPAELAGARDFADAAAERFGLDEARRYQFKLAVSEAVANAIEHGGPRPDGTLLVEIAEHGDDLTCTITDGGSFTPLPGEPEVMPERGRGIGFMTALADRVDIRQDDNGTVVSLTVSR